MSRRITVVGFMLLIGTSLAACNRNSDDDVPANDPFASAGRQEDQFGKGFGKAFRADPNATPRVVSENDVTPVSTTAEPVMID